MNGLAETHALVALMSDDGLLHASTVIPADQIPLLHHHVTVVCDPGALFLEEDDMTTDRPIILIGEIHNNNTTRHRSRSPPRRSRISPKPAANRAEEDRAAKLAAMSSNASSMNVERQQRLAELLEKEKAEQEAEEKLRAKSKGMGGFLSHEQKKVFGGVGGLEERIRRGRGGMVVDAD